MARDSEKCDNLARVLVEDATISPQQSLHTCNATMRTYLLRIWRNIRGPKPPAGRSTTLSTKAKLLSKSSSSSVYLAAPDGPLRAIKVSKDADAIFKEYCRLLEVEAGFVNTYRLLQRKGVLLSVPYVPHSGFHFPRVLRSETKGLFKSTSITIPKKASGYTMEYIRPFNDIHARYLIKRYLAPSAQEAAVANMSKQHFIVKPYLGNLRPFADQWNSELHNRPVYADQLISEGVDVRALASSMAAALATMHWYSGLDAKAVKFIMGCDSGGCIRMWLIDFAECGKFKKTPEDVKTTLVDAIVQNEQFWPRWIDLDGHREVWSTFQRSYLEVSNHILESLGRKEWALLPVLFMDELDKIRGPPKPML